MHARRRKRALRRHKPRWQRGNSGGRVRRRAGADRFRERAAREQRGAIVHRP